MTGKHIDLQGVYCHTILQSFHWLLVLALRERRRICDSWSDIHNFHNQLFDDMSILDRRDYNRN